MLHTWALMALLAGAAAPRAEVSEGIRTAQQLMGDFEEAKALETLDALAARTDLTPAERAQLQLWRGIVMVGQARNEDAAAAFSQARGCDSRLKAPKGINPKARQLFTKAKPAPCPANAAPAPAPVEPARARADLTSS